MTAHELARKLLEMPDIEVRVWDGYRDDWDPIDGVMQYEPWTKMCCSFIIDHEFVGIWS